MKDSVVEQLPQFSNIPLSFQNSLHIGYNEPTGVQKFGSRYLYLGIVPSSNITKGTVQGYRANGQPVEFANSDFNPNSYFAFFPVLNGGPLGAISPGSNIYHKWLDGSQVSTHKLPPEFFMTLEEHFGGGGTRGDTAGVALGMRFKINKPSSKCLKATLIYNTVLYLHRSRSPNDWFISYFSTSYSRKTTFFTIFWPTLAPSPVSR